MPLIVKNIVEIKKEEPVVYNTVSSLASLRPRNKSVVESVPKKTEKNDPVQEEIQSDKHQKGVSLVVDGKERKVSKTSKYLLDMLTLDDQ